MPSSKGEPRYRLVVFDAIDEPEPVRDLFCRVTGLHAADAMIWIARAPGAWPQPMTGAQTRELLDGLYDLGVAAEAWLVEKFPDLNPVRTIHDAACLPEGFRVKGLRGEPTHWVPWPRVEQVCAGRVEVEDEFRNLVPPRWPSAIATGLRALTLRKPRPAPRLERAARVVSEPVGEVLVTRAGPRITFRIVENQMNYAYLGAGLRPSAAENFPRMVADLVARADGAAVPPSTRALLGTGPADEGLFPSSQALLEYANIRLLWSKYQRDRERALDRRRDQDEEREKDAD